MPQTIVRSAPAMPSSTGWQPSPFREYVIKVHNGCDLACHYCYMYRLADRRAWIDRSAMAELTFDRTAARIREHLLRHGLTRARAVFHGGEPLLVGADRLSRMAGQLREAMPSGTAMDVTIQTNAVRLRARDIELFATHGIRVGVSLDGDRQANDRHRRSAGGRSSFDAVHRALGLLGQRPDIFAGILCVVDLANDPARTYDALVQHRPPTVDFLLPHGNWTVLPPGYSDQPRYGAWLAAAFDRWYGAPARETGVRFFEAVINLLFGGPSRTEGIGGTPAATIVINVDGSYEDIDTLRSAYAGAVDTGLNVFDHSLDEALHHPDVLARRQSTVATVGECRVCPVRRVCGGGYYPHRYRDGDGFANPSVYSRDLRHLIGHIATRLHADVARLKGKS
jgi:uncharacterized protein